MKLGFFFLWNILEKIRHRFQKVIALNKVLLRRLDIIGLVDNLSKQDRKKTMQAVKSKGTSLEKTVRAMIIRSGVGGWEVNPKNIVGKPDFIFPADKIAIFVDGCFWHGCPTCKKPLPKTNADYWRKKINKNVQRDKKYENILKSDGWNVIRIWEHEITNKEDRPFLIHRINDLIESPINRT